MGCLMPIRFPPVRRGRAIRSKPPGAPPPSRAGRVLAARLNPLTSSMVQPSNHTIDSIAGFARRHGRARCAPGGPIPRDDGGDADSPKRVPELSARLEWIRMQGRIRP